MLHVELTKAASTDIAIFTAVKPPHSMQRGYVSILLRHKEPRPPNVWVGAVRYTSSLLRGVDRSV